MTPVFILVALFDVLNIELAALLEWLNANNLTLNVDKTFYMIFHRRNIKTDNLKLTIRQGTLKVLEKCTKNLIGHSRLAFNNHESNIDC